MHALQMLTVIEAFLYRKTGDSVQLSEQINGHLPLCGNNAHKPLHPQAQLNKAKSVDLKLVLANRAIYLPLVCLLILSPLPAKADLEAELQGVFSNMVNVTPADAYQTQRRGVISGGSIVLRNNIVNPNLVSFVPPSFKGGCNGIDLFGGSFSFINGAQFTQLLRNIAQSAIGYAFELAIEGMCPTCAQVMSKLQKDINEINSLMRNSCEAATTLVNATGLKAWSDQQRKQASSLNATLGFKSDYFDSQEDSSNAPAATLIANGQSSLITGNVVYNALTQANAASWFTNGDTNLMMALMSLTGTLIISPKSDNSDVQTNYVPPILNVRDMLEGGTVTIYQCESAACLLPDPSVETTTITLTGMRNYAKTMVWGTGPESTGTGGIVRKMVSKASTDQFLPAEQAFIQASRPGVYGVLRGISTEIQSANLVADQLIDIVATEMTNQAIDEMFNVVSKAVKSTGKPMDSAMEEAMHDRRNEILDARKSNQDSIAAINTLVQLQKTIRENLRITMNNKVH